MHSLASVSLNSIAVLTSATVFSFTGPPRHAMFGLSLFEHLFLALRLRRSLIGFVYMKQSFDSFVLSLGYVLVPC